MRRRREAFRRRRRQIPAVVSSFVLILKFAKSERGGSEKSRMDAQRGRLHRDLLHANRLCPSAGFLNYFRNKSYGGTKYSSAKNYLLRIKNADQVSGCHAPKRNAIFNGLQGKRIALVKCLKHIRRGDFFYLSQPSEIVFRGGKRFFYLLNNAFAGCAAFQMLTFPLVQTIGFLQYHPSDRAGAAAFPPQCCAVCQHACANSGAHGYIYRIPAMLNRSFPLLAQNATCAVAVNFHRQTPGCALDFLQ